MSSAPEQKLDHDHPGTVSPTWYSRRRHRPLVPGRALDRIVREIGRLGSVRPLHFGADRRVFQIEVEGCVVECTIEVRG